MLDANQGRPLAGHAARVRGHAFAPDGLTFASIDDLGLVIVWSLPGASASQRFQTPESNGVRGGEALAFLPSGDLVCSEAGGLVVRSGRSLDDVLRSNRDARPANLEVHGGGRWILAGDRLHDAETLALRTVAPSSTPGEWKGMSCGGANDVVLLYEEVEAWDDDERLLSPAADPELRLLDVDRKTVRRSRSLSKGDASDRVTAIAYDAGREQFVFATKRHGRIEAWSADGSSEVVCASASGVRSLHCFATASAAHVKRANEPDRFLWWLGQFRDLVSELVLPALAWVALSPDGRWLVCRELAKNARDAFELTVFDLAPLALLGAPPEPATTVSLRDYDFAAARLRLAARVDPETRTVRDRHGEYDFERTRNLRELEDGVDDVLAHVEILIVAALCELTIAEGGLVAGATALATAMSATQPLVRALLILGSHPCHPGFAHCALAASGRGVPDDWRGTAHDAGPFLTRQSRPPWSLAALEAAVREGVLAAFGDVEVKPALVPHEVAPGSKLGAYLRILGASWLYDAIGAWDPAFGSHEALAGEWWLLRPVSPHPGHDEVASSVGLDVRGLLPAADVDASDGVVLVCFPRAAMSDDTRASLLEDSRWVATFQRVVWSATTAPPALVEELTRSPGEYPQAPKLGERATPAEEGKRRASALAQAVLASLDAPDDPNQAALEAQNDRRKSKIAQASYLRTKQVAPRPPRSFAGPARTLEELRFAASLEHCPTCNDRIEEQTAELRELGGGLWELTAPCSRCGKIRTFRYPAAEDLARAPLPEHQLGTGPSAMLTAELLREALGEELPLVAPLPAQLDEEDLDISAKANRRALICLHELLELEGSPSARALLAEEYERQLALHAAHAAARRAARRGEG